MQSYLLSYGRGAPGQSGTWIFLDSATWAEDTRSAFPPNRPEGVRHCDRWITDRPLPESRSLWRGMLGADILIVNREVGLRPTPGSAGEADIPSFEGG